MGVPNATVILTVYHGLRANCKRNYGEESLAFLNDFGGGKYIYVYPRPEKANVYIFINIHKYT